MSDSRSDISSNKTDDDDLDVTEKDKDGMNDEVDKQHVLEKITIFRMIHENKCEDGKDISARTRLESLNEIKALYDNLGLPMALEVYMVRIVRWISYRKDLKYWELWDKKEEFLRKNSRSKERERDRIRSRDRRSVRNDRSRSRSRDRLEINDRRRERSRERDNDGNEDSEDERKGKERVK